MAIVLVTPTTSPERATQIVRRSTGFVYCVSVAGITGERAALPSVPAVNDELAELIDRQPDEVAAILRGWLADRRA